MQIEKIEDIIDTALGKEGKYMWECIGDPDLEYFYRGVICNIMEDYADQKLKEFKRAYKKRTRVNYI